MEIYNPPSGEESWYVCLNCEREYELCQILLLSMKDIECPYCESRQFIKSQQPDEYNMNNVYDSSNYDIYDEYY